MEAVEGFRKFTQHARTLVHMREDAVPIFATWTMWFIKSAVVVEHAMLHRRQCFPQRRGPESD